MSINPKPHQKVGIFHVLYNPLGMASKKLFEMKTLVFIQSAFRIDSILGSTQKIAYYRMPSPLWGGHPRNCWTTKYLYFGGKVLFM